MKARKGRKGEAAKEYEKIVEEAKGLGAGDEVVGKLEQWMTRFK